VEVVFRIDRSLNSRGFRMAVACPVAIPQGMLRFLLVSLLELMYAGGDSQLCAVESLPDKRVRSPQSGLTKGTNAGCHQPQVAKRTCQINDPAESPPWPSPRVLVFRPTEGDLSSWIASTAPSRSSNPGLVSWRTLFQFFVVQTAWWTVREGQSSPIRDNE
jgi:hypothetical protein